MLYTIILLSLSIILIAIIIYKIDAILNKLHSPYDKGYIKFYKTVEKALNHQQKVQLEYAQILAKQIAEFNAYLEMQIKREKKISRKLKNENTRNRSC